MSSLTQEDQNQILGLFNSLEYPKKIGKLEMVKYKKTKQSNKSDLAPIIASTTGWPQVPIKERANIISTLAEKISEYDPSNFSLPASDAKSAIEYLVSQLENYATSYTQCPEEWKPSGLAVAIFSENNSIASIGAFLGAALLTGYKIIIQSSDVVWAKSNFREFLLMAAGNSGIPANTITILGEDHFPIGAFAQCEDVALLAVYDDLLKTKYRSITAKCLQLLNFASSVFGASGIIYASADVDSATVALLKAACTHNGNVPWAVRRLLVQESVLPSVVDSLKRVLAHGRSVLLHEAHFYREEFREVYTQVRAEATQRGIEFLENQQAGFLVLMDGDDILRNTPNVAQTPILSVSAFRTVKESVAMANHGRNGFGVSLWSENVSLVNEVVDQLQFGHVWVNSVNLFDGQIANRPHKSSCNFSIGGNELLYDFLPTPKQIGTSLKQFKQVNSTTLPETLPNFIARSKQAQGKWALLSRVNRAKFLRKVNCFQELASNYLLEASSDSYLNINGCNVISKREPQGTVLIVQAEKTINAYLDRLAIVVALLEGNSVIFSSHVNNSTSISTNLIKVLPNDVLINIPYVSDKLNWEFMLKQSEIQTCLVSQFNETLPLPLLNKIKFIDAKVSVKQIQSYVSLSKNIWISNCYSIES